MIDMPHLILNASTPSDTLASDNENQSVSNLLELDEPNDALDTQDTDPSSFVILLAQLLTHPSVDCDEDSSQSQATIDIHESGNKIQDSEANRIPNAAIDPQAELTVADSNAGDSSEAINPVVDASETNNIALTWLESDTYQSEWNNNAEKIVDCTDNSESPLDLKKIIDKISGREKVEQDSKNLSDGGDSSLNKEKTVHNSMSQPVNTLPEIDETTIQQLVSKETRQITIIPEAPTAINVHPNIQTTQEIPQNAHLKYLEIPLDVTHTEWADKFSDHILWLGQQEVNKALIKIHPENLGPLEISVKVVKDNATININSHNIQVRDIIDQAIPKLRDMMHDQGLNLKEVHVGTDTNQRQFSQQHNSPDVDFVGQMDDDLDVTPMLKKVSKGLIDYFA